MLLGLWTTCLCRPLVFGCVFLWLAFGTAWPLFQLCFFCAFLGCNLKFGVCLLLLPWWQPLVSWHLVVLAFGIWLCWPVVGLWHNLAFVSVVYFVQPLVAFLGGNLLFLGLWLCWPLVFGCVGLCLDLVYGWSLAFGCIGLWSLVVLACASCCLAFGCVGLLQLLVSFASCFLAFGCVGLWSLVVLPCASCCLTFGCVSLLQLLLSFGCLLLLGIWLCWPLATLDFVLSLVAASYCLGFGCVGLLQLLLVLWFTVLSALVPALGTIMCCWSAMVGLWFHVDAWPLF
ncbi:uncharacterized protein A4U43_C08F25910 [Asparagus officinalis]|nr:uncharacterized protein A4U43_C08F25910 [Asparagus officinalis]